MFCSNCGKEMTNDSKFCSNCGIEIKTIIIENAKTIHKADEDLKIEISNKSQKILSKFFVSLFIAALFGLISYPISNAILGVYKKDLTPSDFRFQMTVGGDNVSLRRQDLMGQSLNNSIIVGIISFFIIVGIQFIKLEKKQESNSDQSAPIKPEKLEPSIHEQSAHDSKGFTGITFRE